MTPEKPKRSSRPDDKPAADKRGRAGVAIQAFIDPDIRAAIDDYLADYNATHDHKATVTSTLEAALKKYLSIEGHWPRKKS